MHDTSDIRKGLKLEIDGIPFTVVDFQFVKPGKGNGFTRCRIKNLVTGAVLERTWKSGEKLKPAAMDEARMQFLYSDEEGFHFMDQTSYDQYVIETETVGDNQRFLKENLEIDVLLFNGRPVSLSLPNFVELLVAETEPGVKGDTVSGAKKQATLETGAVINVPLFVEQGEKLKIDTRTGDYVERVK